LFDAAELHTPPYNVPKDVTEKIDAKTRAILGTNEVRPRCVALKGRIGHAVECTIYANRPSCCREYKASLEDGMRNSRCDEARRGKGLRPLRLSDWNEFNGKAVDETPASAPEL
jgi:hypothetical protein